jgi:rhodanese-related sulfurtransferase
VPRPLLSDNINRLAREVLILAALALLPAVAAAWYHPHRPSWNEDVFLPDEILVTAAMAQTDPVLWIDARPQKEFDARHVPGALCLNEDDWDRQLPAVLSAWNPAEMVVVYCSSNACQSSREVAERLRQVGLAPVYSLKGGWDTWLKANP